MELLCRIDWQAWAIFGGALINAAAIFFAAVLGTNTLREWMVKRQIDVAIDALTLAHDAVEVFRDIRDPFRLDITPASERAAMSESEWAEERKAFAKEYWGRVMTHAAFFDRLSSMIAQVRIVLGPQCYAKVLVFADVRNHLQRSLQTYIWLSAQDGLRPDEREHLIRLRRDLWQTLDEEDPDPIWRQILDSKTFLEDKLGPLVGSPAVALKKRGWWARLTGTGWP